LSDQKPLIRQRLRHIILAHKEQKLSKLAFWLFAVLIAHCDNKGVSAIDPALLEFPRKSIRKAINELIRNDYLTLIMARGMPPMFSFVNRIEVETFDGGMMATAWCSPSPIRLHED
jgi:hypothetical protein